MNRRLFRTRVGSLLMVWILINTIFIGVLAFGAASIGGSSVEALGGSSRGQVIITSNTTWTKANSPYIITENTLVEEDVTLTIQPGVEVRFEQSIYIKIQGKLIAKGTKNNMINFTANKTSPPSEYWGGLRFVGGSNDSYLDFCKFDYSIGGFSSNIRLNITNCIFSKNTYGLSVGGSIYSMANIINCTFTENIIAGIQIYEGNAIISNCEFYNNRYGIISDGDSSQTILNNYFYNCSSGAISCQNANSTTIQHNIMLKGYRGINYHSTSGSVISVITNNIIKNYEREGIYCGKYTSPQIQYNNISNNDVGIYIYWDGKPKINYNNIFNNVNLSINNSGPQQINAKNNWWGTIDTNSINQSIYDFHDYFERGKVIYEPYLRAPVDINTSPQINHPPVANAGPDQYVSVNQTVTLDASNSYDPDGDTLYYLWSFDDGYLLDTDNDGKPDIFEGVNNPNSPKKITRGYNTSGNYTVTLIVGDKTLNDTDTCIIYVSDIKENTAPVADAGADQNGTINDTFIFDGSKSYDPDSDTLTYKWSFGDGTSTGWQNGSNTSHQYSLAGRYTVTLFVTDGLLSDSDTCIVNVSYAGGKNLPPVANAGLDLIYLVNQSIKFDGSKSYDPNGDPLTYKWSFGDGTSTGWSNLSEVYHSYKKIGNYTVTLTVNDSKLTNTDTCYVIITNKTNQSKNRAPIFTSTPTKEATVGVEWSYKPVVTDPDNDKITINFTTGPQGMSFRNRTLTWTPTQAQIGNHSVKLGATDGKLSVNQEFTISVKNKTQQQNKTPPDDERNKTQPKIIRSNVPNNSTNVSVNNSRISIYFSKSMNRTSVEAALNISPNASYKLYWSNDDTELLIVFNQPLSSNTKYSITIDNSAKDAWGNRLKDPFELKFTTQVAGSKEIKEDKLFSENLGLIVIAIVLLVIIMIFVLTFISKNQRRKKEIREETNGGRHELRGGDIAEEHSIVELNGESEEVITQLRDEALELKKPSSYGLHEDEVKSKIEERYRKGEISKATFDSALEIINKQE